MQSTTRRIPTCLLPKSGWITTQLPKSGWSPCLPKSGW